MSLTSSRVSLVHRCTIERDANAGTTDAWGNPLPPDWQTHLADVQCWAWEVAGREPVDPDRTIVVRDRRLRVPADTDVTERDRIATVTHRGTVLLAGPLGIEAVLRHGDHLELVVTGVN